MAKPVKCPECGGIDTAPDDHGNAVKCRECGANVTVSADKGETGIAPPSPPSPPALPRARPPRSRDEDDGFGSGRSIARNKKTSGAGTGMMLIIGGVVAASCLICGGIGIGVPIVGIAVWRTKAVNVKQANNANLAIKGIDKGIVTKKVEDKVAKDFFKEVDFPFKDGKGGPPRDAFNDGVGIKDNKDAFNKDAFNKDAFDGPPKDFIKDFFVKDFKGPGPAPGPGVVIFNQVARISPADPMRDGKSHKPFQLRLEQGRTYVIDMVSGEMDSYLRLYDPTGLKIAEDDDGGGYPNARIRFTANQTGNYTIAATYFGSVPNQGANFTLTVRQE